MIWEEKGLETNNMELNIKENNKNVQKLDATKYLNKNVKVIMDRKMGSKHPDWDMIYPVNYGYVPNTISGDGEELDCYILGVFEPLDEFYGECIAVVHRLEEDDDKLVIVPKGKRYSNEQIEALIEFQERFFKHEIIRDVK